MPTGREASPREARIDLHCHTSASFDGVSDPVALVGRAHERGLTHLAITDHDTVDAARAAAAAAPPGLTVIIGSEVLTRAGDLVALFLQASIPSGLAPAEAIAAIRAQGGLVGIPHPFDRDRRSLLRDPAQVALVPLVDWVEGWNGRVARSEANAEAMALATRTGLPALAVSDAHSLIEVGTAWTQLEGDPSTPDGLLAALALGPVPVIAHPRGPGPAAASRRAGWRGWRPSRLGRS